MSTLISLIHDPVCPSSPSRKAFLARMEDLCNQLRNHVDPDWAVDQVAKDYLAAALPPLLSDGQLLTPFLLKPKEVQTH